MKQRPSIAKTKNPIFDHISFHVSQFHSFELCNPNVHCHELWGRPGHLDLPTVPLLLPRLRWEEGGGVSKSSVITGHRGGEESRPGAITAALAAITLPLIITSINHQVGWRRAWKEETLMMVVQQTSWSPDHGWVQVAVAPVSLWGLNFIICWKPSQARLTSTGSGPEEVCPVSGSGHILEIQQNLNQHLASIVYTMVHPYYTKIHSNNTSVLTHYIHTYYSASVDYE